MCTYRIHHEDISDEELLEDLEEEVQCTYVLCIIYTLIKCHIYTK